MAAARSSGGETSDLLPFEEVYRLHAPDVYRFCLTQTRSPDAAEDLTADVFVSAYVAYSRVRPCAEVVKYWLLRIARNRIVSRWRGVVRRGRSEARVRMTWRHPDVQDVLAAREELRTVVAAVGRLRQRDRLLIGLRAAQLSYAEVAEFIGVSEGAARVATHRALRALRSELEAPGDA